MFVILRIRFFQLIKILYAFFLPSSCLMCLATCGVNRLCRTCLRHLPRLENRCSQCALPLFAGNPVLCGQCLSDPPPFNNTLALFHYQAPIIKMLAAFKFQHQLAYGAAFSDLLLIKIKAHYQTACLPQAIIPIPLHSQRLRERGFNQALELAKPIGKALQLPIIKSGILRHKATIPQSSLPAKQRQQNIAHAFSITASLPYQHVAVLDDVMTTGQTLREFCRLLQQHGIKQIEVWCIARAAVDH